MPQREILSFYDKNKAFFPAIFFVCGILFDILTLGPIDDKYSIAQQGVYLSLIAILLHLDMIIGEGKKTSGVFSKMWGFRKEALHFMLGSLLSVYTIFFFKSASFLNSFIFLGILVVLLIANELPALKKGSFFIPYSIFALCVTCYWLCIAPMALGEVGWIPFVLAVGVSISMMALFCQLLVRSGVPGEKATSQVLVPSVLVNIIFVFLYWAAILPPVPISIKSIGIYHKLQKANGQFYLYYDRPWWKFWENGAQTFMARDGDRIFCFVKVYSPSKFKEQLSIQWAKRNKKGEWHTWDKISLPVVGGRAEGYRGYVVKENYDPGQWMVAVKTSDDREVGRIYFEVVKSQEESKRIFRTEIH